MQLVLYLLVTGMLGMIALGFFLTDSCTPLRPSSVSGRRESRQCASLFLFLALGLAFFSDNDGALSFLAAAECRFAILQFHLLVGLPGRHAAGGWQPHGVFQFWLFHKTLVMGGFDRGGIVARATCCGADWFGLLRWILV